MAKDLAIVLNNGSINSAVTTALAAQKFRTILIHAQTSNLTGTRARVAYDQQVAHFKPYREHSLMMDYLAAGTAAEGSAAFADPRQTAVAAQVLDLVPLMGAAVRFAAHHQAGAIYVGLRVGSQGDELAQATEYVQIWNELLQLPCGQPELDILAPVLELEPWQVVDVGFQVGIPFDKTWSCLEEGTDPCWACPGCRNREAAFQQAGKSDPLRAVKKTAS